jgi:signal transduction histidine kinase
MTDFLNCNFDKAIFFIFSGNVYDPLIYYSHLLPLVSSFILGIFVFLSDKKSLKNVLFFLLTVLFSIWIYFDLILWASESKEYIMFFWSLLVPIEFFIFFVTFLLTRKFVSDNKISNIYKGLFGLLFTPILFLLQSSYTLTAFDYTNCDRGAIEGPLCLYLYLVEIIIFFIILCEIIYALIKDKVNRKKTAIYSVGIISFLGLFIIGNVTLIQDMNWGYEQYKLFGMLGFLIILVFLIVRFKTFNIKLIGAQALVWSIIILIGSQFFFIKTNINKVLNSFTLLFTAITGYLLVQSVKREVNLREELETSNKNQESLIHFVSHQLKGFFTKSKMIFAGIIEEDFGQTSETMKSVAREGLSSDNNAVTMIQEILGASNYKKGTIAYTLKETNFTDIVKEIFCSFTKEVDDRGLEFKLDIPEEALTVLIDRTQMSQVIRNTIDNSIKYTPTGTIKIIVKKTLVGNKEKVIFEVSDTGIGLSAKDKSMLFTEGGKGEDSLKYNTNSTGYGLYIVKKIVENHGGKIWAESAGRGKGSQFYVELDLVK